ncbi:hypothetical protein NERG_00482 [Nematocida ausubeli]|uniref:Cleavage/polyadenylation specificity factor A subunit C-terminal domain-containing protein n=1 Tax=Nematocida ausubeli (strain ATCC PRA-371 / ERTm2) TaxID=1913371 RepID=H8ZA61_NEMA1|nr:hypothetical protein NERG_00482 [Nematocida ausubeli]
MVVNHPKPAIGKNDIEKVQFIFPDEIFFVHGEQDLLVVLLNGKVFKRQSITDNDQKNTERPKYVELFDLKDVVKHAETIDKKLYIATATTLYRINKGAEDKEKIVLQAIHKDDFLKICALSVSEDGEMLVYGDYEGKVTVKTPTTQYECIEHEDAIVGIVILKRVIFTASEDGMLLKTKIGETEPKDAYEVGKPIRYFGKLDNKLVLLDAYGTPYTLSKTTNDLRKEKKLVRKVTFVNKVSDGLYASHDNDHFKITTYKTVNRIQVPPKRTDGLFEYKNRLYFYAGEEITGWEVKKATELEEFFEDL